MSFCLKMNQEMVDDYIGFCKVILGINSAAIGALFFKLNEAVQVSLGYKAASISFFVSMILLILVYTELIEHKITKKDILNLRGSILFFLAIIGFFSGFFILVFKIIFGL